MILSFVSTGIIISKCGKQLVANLQNVANQTKEQIIPFFTLKLAVYSTNNYPQNGKLMIGFAEL